MRQILFTVLLCACFAMRGVGQSREALYADLRQEPLVIDFLYDNTDGDKVFWGHYDLRTKTFTAPQEGFVYSREVLSKIKTNTESQIINVVIVDNTIFYDNDTYRRLENWTVMSILGEAYFFPDSDNGYKNSLAKVLKYPDLQDFMEANKKIPRQEIERLKFYQLNQGAEESRQIRFKNKIRYKVGLYKIEENGRFGLVDDASNIVMPIRYSEAELDKAYVRNFGTPPPLDVFIVNYLENNIPEWNRKDEFETPKDYTLRTTNPSFANFATSLLSHQGCALYEVMYGNIMSSFSLEDYDTGNETFLVRSPLGNIPVKVPAEHSRLFKEKWMEGKIKFSYAGLENSPEGMLLTRLDFILPTPAGSEQFITLHGANTLPYKSYQETASKGIQIRLTKGMPDGENRKFTGSSDVDVNIPISATTAPETFAIIIANENYARESRVPFALRDGEVFAEYCRKTLGIPDKNIRILKDATLNDMKFQLDWLRQVLSAYNGEARAIVYYAGHGVPDEANRSAYLLPADGYGSNTSTGFALADLYATLNKAPARSVTVFLDACFSGAKRESGMMTSARGVAIKVKNETPQGKMVVFSAAQGDETAYQYAEKGHGLFTYFLLKKLQESNGEVTLGELSDYLAEEVKKASVIHNNKIQTPTAIPPVGITDWRNQRLK